jgi:hypothetical protein
MALGFAVFLVFWFIGALIFDFVEVSRSQEMKANPSHGDTATRSISVICTFFLEEHKLMTDSF